MQATTMRKVPRSFPFVICIFGLAALSGIYFGRPGLQMIASSGPHNALFRSSGNKSPLSRHVHTYFDQVYAVDTPPAYGFPALKAACARAEWKEENRDVYLLCDGMSAGITSILSQVKVCFKMAVDAGVNVLLPSMPLRDSEDLKNFNFGNHSAYFTYDQWFDSEHFTSSMARACPNMKIRHPKNLDTPAMPLAHEWNIDIGTAPGFKFLAGYFWVGRPFKQWFDEELQKVRSAIPAARNQKGQGATIVKVLSQFLIYRITDDATGRDLALWNDISHLIRFKKDPRVITNSILALLKGPFIGLHFRTENDSIWSSFEDQLERDLKMLDQITDQAMTPNAAKPIVYIACGDERRITKFAEAAEPRGWTVTSKYDIVKNEPATLSKLKELPFDFQGAVDMGVMLKSHFFLGITGSAFSSTIANMRDVIGRYRGSSILFPDDENARTHLFNDGDASGYACCL